jgi:hypothetical protein
VQIQDETGVESVLPCQQCQEVTAKKWHRLGKEKSHSKEALNHLKIVAF